MVVLMFAPRSREAQRVVAANQEGTDALCELFRREGAAEPDDPFVELGVGGVDAVAIRFEEGQHCDERGAFVSVDLLQRCRARARRPGG